MTITIPPFWCLFFISFHFFSLQIVAEGNLNKGSAKLAFEDNFQQKSPIGTDALGYHGPASQVVPPFEDSFSVPLSAHAVPKTPRAKSGPRATLFQISNSQPLPTRTYNCSGKKDGIFLERNGTCAKTFWSCSNGKAFPYGCPQGLFYNIGNGQCDHPANVVACGGRPQHSRWENSSASDGTFVPFNCSAKGNGLHALAHCVSDVFFACLGGRPISMSACSSGLKFDQQKGECAFADQCGKKSDESSHAKGNSMDPFLEHGTSNYYFGNGYAQRHRQVLSDNKLFNCSGKPNGAFEKAYCAPSFFQCIDGVASEANCTTNLVFDANHAKCTAPQICWQKSTNWTMDQRQNGQMERQTQAEPMASPQMRSMASEAQPVSPPKPSQSPVRFNCVGKTDGNYALRPCQPTYFVCSNSAPVQMNCPAKLVFDPIAGACEYADNCAKNTVPGDPSSPWSPAPSVGTTSVPLPLYFPSHLPPSSVPSPSQVAQSVHFNCSAKSNGHYGDGGHCQPNFIFCVNGLAIPQKCQDPLVYDETSGKCEHAQKCGQIGASLPQHSRPSDQQVPLSPTGLSRPSPQVPPFAPASPPLPPTVAPSRRPMFTQSSFRCRGRSDGYYFKRPCSPHFYTCVEGHPTQLTCPGNLVFDPSRALCQYPQMCNYSANAPDKRTTLGALAPAPVDPPQPPPPFTDFHCGTKRNGYYVRQPCTGHFYTCLGGKATKLACPGKLVFDMNSLSCQYAVNCAAGEDGTAPQHNPSPSVSGDPPQHQPNEPQQQPNTLATSTQRPI